MVMPAFDQELLSNLFFFFFFLNSSRVSKKFTCTESPIRISEISRSNEVESDERNLPLRLIFRASCRDLSDPTSTPKQEVISSISDSLCSIDHKIDWVLDTISYSPLAEGSI